MFTKTVSVSAKASIHTPIPPTITHPYQGILRRLLRTSRRSRRSLCNERIWSVIPAGRMGQERCALLRHVERTVRVNLVGLAVVRDRAGRALLDQGVVLEDEPFLWVGYVPLRL